MIAEKALETAVYIGARQYLIYEHVTPVKMTEQHLSAYNKANPSHPMTGFDNINYCLALKK